VEVYAGKKGRTQDFYKKKFIMLKYNCIVIVLLAAALQGQNIPVTVQEALPSVIPGRARSGEPVTVGIPLQDSDNITDASQLGLSGPDAGQFRVLSRYHSGNVKWVLADFQASVGAGGSTTVALTNGSGAFGGPVLAQDDGAFISVNTGAAQFVVRKANFNVLHSVIIDGQSMLSGNDGAIESRDSSGTLFSSINDDGSSAFIEENGPVRAAVTAAGRLMTSSGEGHLWYTVRLSFYRNAQYVHAEVTFRNADFDVRTYQLFNSLSMTLPLATSGNVGLTFARETAANPWTGQLSPGQSAHIYQGYQPYRETPYAGGCYGWDPPVPGTCDQNADYVYTYDPDNTGIEVISGATALQTGGNSLYTQGWADFTDSNGKGAAIALRWMCALWPASFEIQSDGRMEIGFYSKFNPKKGLRYNWGTHETREVMIDFHTAAKSGEAVLYRLEYPLVARAPFEQYRVTGAFFNQIEIVTISEEEEWFAKYGEPLPGWANYSNPEVQVRRFEHWRRGYSQHETGLLNFLRTGYSGYYLSSRQQIRFNADQPVTHSDGFDLWEYPSFSATGNMGQNPFDVEHQETMSFPIYYYMSGDARIREAIDDYGEHQLFRTNNGHFGMPGTPYFRAWCRRFRNFAWLYEFTGDAMYLEPVFSSIDFIIDERTDGSMEKRGRNLERGFLYMSPTITACETRAVHAFFNPEIFGEAGFQVLRVLRDKHVGYSRLEDYEDALLGVAQFFMNEAGWTGNNFYWVPYDYCLDKPNQLTAFTGSPYMGSRHIYNLYMMTGDTTHFEHGFQIYWNKGQYVSSNNAARAQQQALIHADMKRPPPVPGWRELPFESVDNGDGSYTLSWTVPSGAKFYKIKYAQKEIVEWLGFDQITRQYQFAPANYTPYFAAHNVSGEPEPQAQGTVQTHTVTGLDPSTDYYFSVRVSTTFGGITGLPGSADAKNSRKPMLLCRPGTEGGVRIHYSVPKSMHVTISVYNASGKRVSKLLSGTAPGGICSVWWDGMDSGYGIYIIELKTPAARVTEKALVLNARPGAGMK
jgi:hypothetical protein